MKNTSLQSLFSPVPSAPVSPRRRFSIAAWFPWLLLLGFVALSLLLFGKSILPARSVELSKVVTVRSVNEARTEATVSPAELDPWSGSTLFQASGWVEPDPLPIKATALINGVVETVAALEGETVKKGQVLASMIQEDFELDLETAKSELASLQGLYEAHEAAIKAVHAEHETLMLQIKAGEMRCLELIDRRDRLTKAGGGAVAEGERVSAELMLQTHEAEVDALAASAEEILSEVKRLEAMRVDFEARIRKAETEVSRRQLALDRTEIKSPVDGVVLRLLVSPGQKRMLDMDDPDSATVAILYQPDFLQARIDVPLEEASQLSVGQAVRLRSNFLQDQIFEGTVTRIVGEADLQRNTLQAKVKFHEPDRRLRPDMLCRAEFLANPSGSGGGLSSGSSGQDRVSVFVSESALYERSGREARVWTLDSSGDRLERRDIVIGSERRDGFFRVVEGLRPGEFVISNPPADLAEGERVKPSADKSE